QEIFHGSHQKGPKPAAIPHCLREMSYFQKPSEEFLGQILRLMRTVTALANECVNGKPVGLAQSGQRLATLGRILRASGQHLRPVSGVETSNGDRFGRLFRTIHRPAVCRNRTTSQKRSLVEALRGCSDLAASAPSKIPCRRTSPNFKTGSEHLSTRHEPKRK